MNYIFNKYIYIVRGRRAEILWDTFFSQVLPVQPKELIPEVDIEWELIQSMSISY